MAQNIVKCAFCGNGVFKVDAKRYKNKNYHEECMNKQIEKENLTEYICKLFSLKAPGPRIYTQLKNFFEKYPNYTYKGIRQALEYFYEVRKNKIDKANQGIGIVPYVYDEAENYYNGISQRQERVANELNNSLLVAPQEIKVQKKDKKKKNLYDLDNL